MKKSLSQNFLRDSNIAKKIVSFADCKNKTVVEIGPGDGSLTKYLLREAKEVYAIEKDSSLLSLLEKKFPLLHLYHNSFLSFFLETIPGDKIDIVANIPYNISKEILQRLILYREKIVKATLLVQHELAQKLLENRVHSYTDCILKSISSITKGFFVSRNCFYPKPRVDSFVIQILFKPFKSIHKWEEYLFLIKKIFHRKRKKLLSTLKETYPKANFANIWEKEELKEGVRADGLSSDELLSIFNQIENL